MNTADLILATGGLMSPQECDTLTDYAMRSEGAALEVGHYTGLSTICIARGLKENTRFVSVDHHAWREVEWGDYLKTVEDATARLNFEPIKGFFEVVVPPGPFGFVFYDASHAPSDVQMFVSMLPELCAEHCTVIFDDWDWTEDHVDLAALGFYQIDTPVHRHQISYTTGNEQVDLDLGKRHPDTFTLGIFQR